VAVKFYLDEDVTVRLLDALAQFGIDAVSANTGHKGIDDPTQLLIARQLDRILVTNNTSDYLLLHRAWLRWSVAWNPFPLPKHAGILLIHSAPGFDFARTAWVISALASDLHDAAALQNRAFAWNPSAGWHER
jgi:hypothetical protein